MLSLSKKTDYALIALAYVAGHEACVASAREIALATDLPLPLLMQILKTLHRQGVLDSTRGVKGGYRLADDAESLSLRSLIRMMDGDAAEAVELPADHALQAMHRKLLAFLDGVKVFDVIRPGRRIDVPVESVRVIERIKGSEPLTRSVYEEQVQPA